MIICDMFGLFVLYNCYIIEEQRFLLHMISNEIVFAFSGNPMTSALSTARHTTNHPEVSVAISSRYLEIFEVSFNDNIRMFLTE